jgi:hypothetical protein
MKLKDIDFSSFRVAKKNWVIGMILPYLKSYAQENPESTNLNLFTFALYLKDESKNADNKFNFNEGHKFKDSNEVITFYHLIEFWCFLETLPFCKANPSLESIGKDVNLLDKVKVDLVELHQKNIPWIFYSVCAAIIVFAAITYFLK